MKKFEIGLCEGRHALPVEDCIFDSVINPTDVRGLEQDAHALLWMCLFDDHEPIELVIYVTGLTVALIAAINAAKKLSMVAKITLMHFNRETGDYYHQEVV
jgi:hypothetical protein